MMADDIRSGNHKLHARGVAAILRIENSPLDLFGAVYFIRSGHPLVANEARRVSDVRFSFIDKHSLTSAELWDILGGTT